MEKFIFVITGIFYFGSPKSLAEIIFEESTWMLLKDKKVNLVANDELIEKVFPVLYEGKIRNGSNIIKINWVGKTKNMRITSDLHNIKLADMIKNIEEAIPVVFKFYKNDIIVLDRSDVICYSFPVGFKAGEGEDVKKGVEKWLALNKIWVSHEGLKINYVNNDEFFFDAKINNFEKITLDHLVLLQSQR